MLIQLPPETWMLILGWLQQHDFVKKLNQLTVVDRHFSEMAQHWLHDFRKRQKIGKLRFYTERDGHVGSLILDRAFPRWTSEEGRNPLMRKWMSPVDDWTTVPIAEAPLPENITGFESITIEYFDTKMLAFLRAIQPLLHNLYLDLSFFKSTEHNASFILRHLMQLIPARGGIDTISTDERRVLDLWRQFESIFTQAWLLDIWVSDWSESLGELLALWLHNDVGMEDGHHRVLLIKLAWDTRTKMLMGRIKKIFLAADEDEQHTFFVRVSTIKPISASTLENSVSGEQLRTRNVQVDDKNVWLIYRCPLAATAEWLAEKETELMTFNYEWRSSKDHSKLTIYHPIIGQMYQQNSNDDLEASTSSGQPASKKLRCHFH